MKRLDLAIHLKIRPVHNACLFHNACLLQELVCVPTFSSISGSPKKSFSMLTQKDRVLHYRLAIVYWTYNTMQKVALLAYSLVEKAAQVSATPRTCVVNTMAAVRELATAQMANRCALVGEHPSSLYTCQANVDKACL